MKTPGDINARNRRRAVYRRQLTTRRMTGLRPIKVRPGSALERELNTPISQLPKDPVAQEACRQAANAHAAIDQLMSAFGGGPLTAEQSAALGKVMPAIARLARQTDIEAHLRLAKARSRKRNASRTQKGAAGRRGIGDKSRARVAHVALAVLRSEPRISRTKLADKIHNSIGLSVERTLTLLKQLKIPPPRR